MHETSSDPRFAWTPFYEEFADILLGYRDRRPELLAEIRALAKSSLGWTISTLIILPMEAKVLCATSARSPSWACSIARSRMKHVMGVIRALAAIAALHNDL